MVGMTEMGVGNSVGMLNCTSDGTGVGMAASEGVGMIVGSKAGQARLEGVTKEPLLQTRVSVNSA